MEIDLFGQTQRVGYYSTFTAVSDVDIHGDLELARDAVTGFVHAMRGPGFAGVQFHPESVLTEHGPELLTALIDHCLHSRESADCVSVADLAQ
jgi:phenazine biosynthesis protein phzE